MMDPITITLFDILKGLGWHPKSRKKKGEMKMHTVMKYLMGVSMVVELISVAKHDYLIRDGGVYLDEIPKPQSNNLSQC